MDFQLFQPTLHIVAQGSHGRQWRARGELRGAAM